MNTPSQSPRANQEVAAVFQGIADLLEASGENPFKIKAYRNAVRTLHELNEAVADIDARGELKKIPGFGDAIVGKTKEILATGTCELYERLQAQQSATPAPIADSEDALEQSLLEKRADDEEIASPW